jgi:hypothetical protein
MSLDIQSIQAACAPPAANAPAADRGSDLEASRGETVVTIASTAVAVLVVAVIAVLMGLA